MRIVSKHEFRGCTTTSKQNGDLMHYFNLEDENGESAKIFSEVAGDKLERGKKYDFIIDYSTKYGSLKIKGVR